MTHIIKSNISVAMIALCLSTSALAQDGPLTNECTKAATILAEEVDINWGWSWENQVFERDDDRFTITCRENYDYNKLNYKVESKKEWLLAIQEDNARRIKTKADDEEAMRIRYEKDNKELKKQIARLQSQTRRSCPTPGRNQIAFCFWFSR